MHYLINTGYEHIDRDKKGTIDEVPFVLVALPIHRTLLQDDTQLTHFNRLYENYNFYFKPDSSVTRNRDKIQSWNITNYMYTLLDNEIDKDEDLFTHYTAYMQGRELQDNTAPWG